MKITEQEVRYVAGLANLKLSDAEVARFQADLDQILEHIGKLNEIDTGNGVEPMAQVLYEAERYGHAAGRRPRAAAGQPGGPGQCAASRRGIFQSAQSDRTLTHGNMLLSAPRP